VAAGLVWTIGQDGTLYGLDPSTGAVRQQVSIGEPANHFPTPSIGDGLLLAPSSDRVVAFPATPTSTTPTSTTPTTPTTSPSNAAGASRSSSGSGTSAGEVAGIVVGAVLVLGGAGWVLLRRRRRGAGT
jgi:LPXTG-motif cell wall-anchored protein